MKNKENLVEIYKYIEDFFRNDSIEKTFALCVLLTQNLLTKNQKDTIQECFILHEEITEQKFKSKVNFLLSQNKSVIADIEGDLKNKGYDDPINGSKLYLTNNNPATRERKASCNLFIPKIKEQPNHFLLFIDVLCEKIVCEKKHNEHLKSIAKVAESSVTFDVKEIETYYYKFLEGGGTSVLFGEEGDGKSKLILAIKNKFRDKVFIINCASGIMPNSSSITKAFGRAVQDKRCVIIFDQVDSLVKEIASNSSAWKSALKNILDLIKEKSINFVFVVSKKNTLFMLGNLKFFPGNHKSLIEFKGIKTCGLKKTLNDQLSKHIEPSKIDTIVGMFDDSKPIDLALLRIYLNAAVFLSDVDLKKELSLVQHNYLDFIDKQFLTYFELATKVDVFEKLLKEISFEELTDPLDKLIVMFLSELRIVKKLEDEKTYVFTNKYYIESANRYIGFYAAGRNIAERNIGDIAKKGVNFNDFLNFFSKKDYEEVREYLDEQIISSIRSNELRERHKAAWLFLFAIIYEGKTKVCCEEAKYELFQNILNNTIDDADTRKVFYDVLQNIFSSTNETSSYAKNFVLFASAVLLGNENCNAFLDSDKVKNHINPHFSTVQYAFKDSCALELDPQIMQLFVSALDTRRKAKMVHVPSAVGSNVQLGLSSSDKEALLSTEGIEIVGEKGRFFPPKNLIQVIDTESWARDKDTCKKDFLFDKFLVTNAEFQELVDTHQFDFSRESNFPATKITFYQAQEYAEWWGKKLPDKCIWEYVARLGTNETDSKIFPWNGGWDKNKCNTKLAGIQGLTSVHEHENFATEHPLGCHDMAGNVWEWTISRPNKTIKDYELKRITKGGSWVEMGILPWTWYEFHVYDKYSYKNVVAEEKYGNVGFRCYLEVQDD